MKETPEQSQRGIEYICEANKNLSDLKGEIMETRRIYSLEMEITTLKIKIEDLETEIHKINFEFSHPAPHEEKLLKYYQEKLSYLSEILELTKHIKKLEKELQHV